MPRPARRRLPSTGAQVADSSGPPPRRRPTFVRGTGGSCGWQRLHGKEELG
jgi:hypothetical protein